MGCCKCFALFSVFLLIGLGITGFIFKDKVIREYNEFIASQGESLC